jgi:hypothetical protein
MNVENFIILTLEGGMWHTSQKVREMDERYGLEFGEDEC